MNILVQLKILGRMKENNFVVDRLPFSIPKHQVWITMIFGKTLKTLATPIVFIEPNPTKKNNVCQKPFKKVWNFVKFRQTQISRLFWWVESGQKIWKVFEKHTEHGLNSSFDLIRIRLISYFVLLCNCAFCRHILHSLNNILGKCHFTIYIIVF